MDRIISKAEFARELGVSKPRVSQMVAAGLPVREDGKVDAGLAAAWVESHIDRAGAGGWPTRKTPKPVAQEITTPPAGSAVDVQAILLRARAKKLIADARRAERLENLASGELVAVAEVKDATFNVHREVRDACQNIPTRCAGAVAAAVRRALDAAATPDAVKLPVAEIDALLATEIRKILEDLARNVEAAGGQQ